MEYQINNAKVRYRRIITEILIKSLFSVAFLFIGITQSELSSLSIGAITTTVCLYSLLKFLFVSKKVFYNDKHILSIDGKLVDIGSVSLIRAKRLNPILKFMWSIAKNTVSLIPPNELIEIYVNEGGAEKKYSFFVDFNDTALFMTFISHIRSHYPDINVDI